jgi:hypothetical protein
MAILVLLHQVLLEQSMCRTPAVTDFREKKDMAELSINAAFLRIIFLC